MCALCKAGHIDKQGPIEAEQTHHSDAPGEVDTHHIVTWWLWALGLGTENSSGFWSLSHSTDLSDVRQLSTWSRCKTGMVGSRPQQPLHLDSCLSQIVLLHGGPVTWACLSSSQVLCVCPAHLLGIPWSLCIAANSPLPIHSLKLPSFTLTSCFPFFLGLTTLFNYPADLFPCLVFISR